LRIVHLSDLHIFCPDAISFQKIMNKRLLGLANWYLKRKRQVNYDIFPVLLETLKNLAPEVICITGDLTHLGMKKEFQKSESLLNDMHSIAPVKLVPGNHDLYIKDSAVDMEKILGRFFSITDTEKSQIKKAGENNLFPQIDVVENIALIGLSSSYPCSLLKATGRLGKKQLRKLSVALDELSDKKSLKIVLIHHPSVSGLVKKRKELLDNKALEALRISKGIELFLFGHSHRRFICVDDDKAPKSLHLCAPSITSIKKAAEKRAGFYVLDIMAKKKPFEIKVQDLILSERGNRFVLNGQFSLNLQPKPPFSAC